jgi:hypothetical protein
MTSADRFSTVVTTAVALSAEKAADQHRTSATAVAMKDAWSG